MQHYTILPFPTQFQGSSAAPNCTASTTSSTSTPFSIIPTYTGDPTNPTDSPPPPGQGQGGQGGPPQPGIPSSAQFYLPLHLLLLDRLFLDLGLATDTHMAALPWYRFLTARTVYTFLATLILLLNVPIAILVAIAA
ncbi:hypothetical protein B0H13DRAFT_2339055 [Mycena leptocephala]|nr:hypothetical protein B0H13DRAFT_2339055 [Mycena leptocephala]